MIYKSTSCNFFENGKMPIMIENNKQETVQLLLNQNFIGWRHDAAIAHLLPDYSRVKVSSWIKNNKALIAGKPVIGKERIRQVSTVEITINITPSHQWHAQDIAIEVVYQDEHIIVINKPAGLVTHPGAGNMNGTLANALLHFDGSLSELDRAGIVHRLDKDTSGLMVVARSQLAQKSLIKQLQSHTVAREYNAIIYGYLIAGGTVNANIGRHPRDRIKQAVLEMGGKPAISHYRIIKRFVHHTLVKVFLETGRTHQIRVHLSHIGHGLVADKQYGKGLYFPKGADEALKQGVKDMPRHCLHAKKLTLIHPKTQEEMSWQTPMPADMKTFLSILQQHDALPHTPIT